MLEVVLLDQLGEVVDLKTSMQEEATQHHMQVTCRSHAGHMCIVSCDAWHTCTEATIVLRANTIALSLTVDWLSNAPCVSIRRTATSSPVDWLVMINGLLHNRIPAVNRGGPGTGKGQVTPRHT